jgi:hypothetical protein
MWQAPLFAPFFTPERRDAIANLSKYFFLQSLSSSVELCPAKEVVSE